MLTISLIFTAWLYSEFKTETGISKHLVTTWLHTLHANYSVIEIYIQLASRRGSPSLAKKAPLLAGTLRALIPAINKLVASRGSNSSRTRLGRKQSQHKVQSHSRSKSHTRSLPWWTHYRACAPGEIYPLRKSSLRQLHMANISWQNYSSGCAGWAECFMCDVRQ